MRYQEFFAAVQARQEKSVSCLILLKDFARGVDAQPSNPPNWREEEIEAEQLQELVRALQQSFMMTGARLANVENDPVWEEATDAANACIAVLNEAFGARLAEVKVLSPTAMMEELGLITVVKGDDGQTYVRPT